MKTVSRFGTFLMIAAFAVPASAKLTFYGADDLTVVTRQMIRICFHYGTLSADISPPFDANISFVGGGGPRGEQNMQLPFGNLNAQPIAPMTRALRDNEGLLVTTPPDLCADPDSELSTTTNHELVIARDALSLVTNPTNLAGMTPLLVPGPPGGVIPAPQTNVCENMKQAGSVPVLTDNGDGTIQCPAGVYCTGTGPTLAYPIKDWKDLLRVAYFGVATNGAGATTTDCNSDIRHSVLSDIRNFSNAPGDCAAPAASGPVSHLWRRDELSASTQAFRAALGIGTTQFCNAGAGGVVVPGVAAPLTSDEVDQDPIRRTCKGSPNSAGADAVCGCDGKLGVVQAIAVPGGYSVSELYYRDAVSNPTGIPDCSTARSIAAVADTQTGPADKCLFNLKNATGASQQYRSISGKCIVPIGGTAAAPVYGCRWKSSPITLSACDNRVFNMQARQAVGGELLTHASTNRPVINAVFRVRPECMDLDSDRQITCLAFNYPNSIGYTAFEPSTVVASYRMQGVKGTETTVHQRIDDVPGAANSSDLDTVAYSEGYAFSRPLFLNSIFDLNTETAISGWEGGFSDLPGPWDPDFAALVTCFNNPQYLEWAIVGSSAVPAPPAAIGFLANTKLLPPRDASKHPFAYAANPVSCAVDAAP